MTDATDISERARTAATGLSFWMLGPLTVTRSARELHLGGRQQQAVLACLLIEAGHTVSRSRLSEELWGDDVPRGAATTIQTYVSHLRDVLEPGRDHHERPSVLVTGNGGYRLEVDESRVDSLEFRRRVEHGQSLLRGGEARDVATAAAELREALSAWRGDALSNLVEYRFAEEESTRLHELRLAASEALADADLRLGQHAEAVGALLPLVAVNPLRERLHEQLMLALYRSGRQAEALEVHARLVARLAGDLGVDPSPSVEALHLAILRHDPGLDRPEEPEPADVAPADVAPAGAPREAGPPRQRSSVPPQPASTRRSRPRLRALGGVVAVVTLLAALVATAMLRPWSGRDPPLTVAANTVSELDDSGAVSASVPVGTNPVAVAKGGGAVWVTQRERRQRLQDRPGDARRAAGPRGRGRPTVAGRHPTRPVGVELRRRHRVPDQPRCEPGRGHHRGRRRAGRDRRGSAPGSGWPTAATTPSSASTARAAPRGPRSTSVTARTDWRWTPRRCGSPTGGTGRSTRIDAGTGERMSAPIRVGSGPRGIVRAGHEVWVANELSQNVTQIDVGTRRTHTIDVGDGPTSVAVAGGGVWVAEKYSGDLVRIDARTEETTRYDLGGDLRGVAVVDGRLWVTSGASASSGHQGGTVRVATGDLPGSFSGRDPAGVYDRDAAHAQRVVYDTLLTYSYTPATPQVVVPDLATSVPEPHRQRPDLHLQPVRGSGTRPVGSSGPPTSSEASRVRWSRPGTTGLLRRHPRRAGVHRPPRRSL